MATPEALAQAAVSGYAQQFPEFVRQEAVAAGVNWPVDGTIYQYTSIQTLMSMLTPGSAFVHNHPSVLAPAFQHIWATSAHYLNDSREFDHGRDVMLAAGARAAAIVPPLPQDIVDVVLNSVKDSNGLEVYCACFSLDKDHLGQWRGYGDNGRGCTLGFDLKKLASSINGVGAWVVYGDGAAGGTSAPVEQQVADTLYQFLVRTLDGGAPAIPSDRARFLAMAEAELKKLLPAIFLVFKNKWFSDEHEYRVITSQYIYPLTVAGSPLRWFRSLGPAIIPFTKVGFGGSGKAPLVEVTLGPASQFSKNPESLRLMLDSCGLLAVETSRSAIPYVPR